MENTAGRPGVRPAGYIISVRLHVREIAHYDELVVLVHDDHRMSLAPQIPRDHGLPPPVILCMAKQLLAGLAALHAAHVAHWGPALGQRVFKRVARAQGLYRSALDHGHSDWRSSLLVRRQVQLAGGRKRSPAGVARSATGTISEG